MAKKLEVRENDRILVWLEVARVSENALEDQIVTVTVPTLVLGAGVNKVTALLDDFHLVKVERGNNWPEG